MLKILILLSLTFNLAFAKSRFTEEDRRKFMEEVKQGIAAHKVDNKGNVDFQIIKPTLYEELDIYYKQQKFTREEVVKMKQDYEGFIKKSSNLFSGDEKEKAFISFIEQDLNEINQSEVAKIKEGEVCNNWGCEEGLKCAPDPVQVDGKSCLKMGKECRDDKDCCSSSCTMDTKKQKRFCEEVYRCFKPLDLGESCMTNPVCGEGDCLPYNSKTSGIGECEDNKHSCKKNSDCCSNSCVEKKCSISFICKDCVKNGSKPQRGQTCCEGLYQDQSGRCVPDMPPIVPPQVKNDKVSDKIVATLASLLLNSAHADEAYDEVNSDRDKYSNYQATSSTPDAVKVKSANFTLTRKSDFNTCDVKFRDDFLQYLQQEKLLDLELAMISFNFVFLGDGVNDYWKLTSDENSSIYGRLKAIAQRQQQMREADNAKMQTINHKLTCMCLDAQGFQNIKDETKKKFFMEECEEYKTALAGAVCYKSVPCDTASAGTPVCNNGRMLTTNGCLLGESDCVCTQSQIQSIQKETASGIKGKRLIVTFTSKLTEFNQALTVDHTETYNAISKVGAYTNQANWNDTSTKTYSLFNFSLKNPSGSVAAMGAILGALLAAGVIAVLGGFATTSMLSAWAAAGIIATSAATGGTGLWLIASLKGAWISKRPVVYDNMISQYGCGKKETCQDWSRKLTQPYNNICNVHASANACVKNFVVWNDEATGEPRYVVDPWVPWGVPKAELLRDTGGVRNYAEKLEDGFQEAKDAMIAKNPGATGGGGKDGGGAFVSEDYMRQLFIDSDVLGHYAPKIGTDENQYLLTSDVVEKIKTQAGKFLILSQLVERHVIASPTKDMQTSRYCVKDTDQSIYCSDDKDNIDKFADYAYEFHFKWPKTSRLKEISYPTVALSTYLDLMSNGVVFSMASGATKAANTFGLLNAQYLDDYLKTLDLYKSNTVDCAAGQTCTGTSKTISTDADKVKADLDAQKLTNALAGNGTLDAQLLNLNPNTLSGAAKQAGINGGNLSSGQSAFLNAIGSLRKARKDQLKKLDFFNKAMASKGKSNADRTAKMAAVSKKFSNAFIKPLSGGRGGSSSGSSLFGSGGADGLSSDANGKDKNGSGGDGSGKNGAGSGYGAYGIGSLGNGTYGNGGDGSGANAYGAGGDGSGNGYGKNGKGGTGSGDTGANLNALGKANGMSDEDARRLAEAIEARDRANQEKYKSQADKTLFEQVTNAYIRNYDKVLIKKKTDKDVIEQK